MNDAIEVQSPGRHTSDGLRHPGLLDMRRMTWNVEATTRACQCGTQLCEGLDALGNIVIGAGLQCGNRRVLITRAGQQDNGHRQLSFADLGQQFQAAAVRELQVDQRCIVSLGVLQSLTCLGQAARQVDAYPFG